MKGLLQFLRSLFTAHAGKKPLEQEEGGKSHYIKSLLSSKLNHTVNAAEERSDTVIPAPKDGRIYNPFDWIRWILLWTNIHVVCLGILAAVMWAAVFILQTREYRVIDLPKPLISQIQDAIYDENGISNADIERNVHMVLHLLNTFSYSSPPKLTLLQGIVNPNIISSSEGSYSINKKKMDDSSFVQNISITAIPKIQKNARNRRISVIAEGFIGVLTQPNNAADLPSRTVPYRAELTYIVRPPSALSGRESLYLLQITEASGTRDVSIFNEAFNTDK